MSRIKLIDLPNLPLTETYSQTFNGINSSSYDAELFFDPKTGLVSLDNDLAKVSYNEKSYNYRTNSFAGNVSRDLQRFIEFVKFVEVNLEISPKRIIEIGGNDLTLAKALHDDYEKLIVIDPLAPKDFKDKRFKKINSLSQYDSAVDFSSFNDEANLIISRHTIEHIKDPSSHFKKLSEELNYDNVYVYEFPDIRQLINSLRFDAIFHQHISYFDVYSFIKYINTFGFEVITMRLNTLGSCGGSTQIAFTKKKLNKKLTKNEIANFAYPVLSNDEFISYFRKLHTFYRSVCDNLINQIEYSNLPLCGYGAALMLPTFFYHTGIDPNYLDCIYDDDPQKKGLTYTNVPLKILAPDPTLKEYDWNCLITSLESYRPIYRAVSSKYSPKRIYSLSSVS